MMKKSFFLALVVLLAGCQSNPQSQVRLKAKQSSKFPTAVELKNQCESQIPQAKADRDTLLWVCQFTSAIQYRLFDTDLYRGKICTLQVTQPVGQQPTDVMVLEGNQKLCAAAVDAIKGAIESETFPMRPKSMNEVIPVRVAPQ
ncbi:cell envelope integrity TolA C-terminal domain-containing protein [Pantoea sp. ICBG 1758]|uniref:cell envelope integrity TolA C-terminal domain-containing protein n=1 Tax=Pantoea sp. ICBG 1758 TaxID=2071682 RepID=UPI001E3C2E1A|nr:cell envelope integrity TolA C-terminal domain-containing protein [Pantoea sp. ICBG 1758]